MRHLWKPRNGSIAFSTRSTSTENLPETSNHDSITNFLHENKPAQIERTITEPINDDFTRAFRMKKVEEIRSNLYARQISNKIGVDIKPTREFLYRTERIKDKNVACGTSDLKLIESRASLYRNNKIKDAGMLTEGLQKERDNISEYKTKENKKIGTNKEVTVRIEEFVVEEKMTLSPARTITRSNIALTNENRPETSNKKVGKTLANVGITCELNEEKPTIENKQLQTVAKSRLYDESCIEEDKEGIVLTRGRRREHSRSPLRRIIATKSSSLMFELTQSRISKGEDLGRPAKIRSGSEILNTKSNLDKGSQFGQRLKYHDMNCGLSLD